MLRAGVRGLRPGVWPLPARIAGLNAGERCLRSKRPATAIWDAYDACLRGSLHGARRRLAGGLGALHAESGRCGWLIRVG